MQSLYNTYRRLLAQTTTNFMRYLYNEINWDNRLIIIRGAKGVGKTTLMLQHIKNVYNNPDKAFYASLDNIWFGANTILSLVDYLYTHGVEAIYLDEVHKYPNWRQEIKNAYDSYPDIKIIITGSSMLELTSSAIGDLSRRARLYTMKGLSFREYLNFELGTDFHPYSLTDIITSHTALAMEITSGLKILPNFESYLKHGYYPFYKEDGDGFYDRLTRIVTTVVETEIPAMGDLQFSSVYKVRQLLAILAEQIPYTLNVSLLSKDLQTSRDNIIKLITLLSKAALTINLYSDDGYKSLSKPTKILFDNTNLMEALSANCDTGTMRETVFASQLQGLHKLAMPQKGDFLVESKYLFEVGGRKKGYKQIKDMPQSYIVADDIECGFGNKIPLWIFGFLY